MRIGVFGGSFDPVHRGHLVLADSCLRQAQLDQVLFVPASRQPLKPRGPIASNEDRAAMVRLAIDGREGFAVSTIEFDRGGVSYTVDTLRTIAAANQGAKLYFLMGEDSLADFSHWREPREICELAVPLVVRRAGQKGAANAPWEPLREFASAERLSEVAAAAVEMPPTPISSSEIRRLIAAGGAWQDLVPATVARFIEERGLYR